VAFSVDPEFDTPEVLRAYAARFEIDLENFRFLTGDIEVIRKTSVDGFKMALEGRPDPKAEHLGILHGSHLVLVDSALAIRGFYRTDSREETKALLDDAERL
jgi:protein SCO1/2